ncbi:hypothetical protein ONZ43_g3889 [Nemania bipapillata]|uniref:Uncharacterized protein n=1 Tax=Nemania bipapillata TaxID=110536 RepID=A0ACC2IV74_9PEZI|nr:hypothetical protein ONZ43_g3889 [Nemania bipapillata]
MDDSTTDLTVASLSFDRHGQISQSHSSPTSQEQEPDSVTNFSPVSPDPTDDKIQNADIEGSNSGLRKGASGKVSHAGDASSDFQHYDSELESLKHKVKALERHLRSLYYHAQSTPPKREEVVLSNGSKSSSETVDEGTNTAETSSIVRRVYKDTGDRLSDAKTYRLVSEEDYDGLRDMNSGYPIEMTKVVKVIQPPNGSKSAVMRGNGMLDNEIIDHIKSETMTIRSKTLLEELKKIIYWPSAAFYHGQQKLQLSYPYRSLCVYRDELEKLLEAKTKELSEAEDSSDDAARLKLTHDHLSLVLAEVDKVSKANVILEDERHSRPEPVATFDMLWKLFRPGTEVYLYEDGQETAAKVRLLRWDYGPLAMNDQSDRPFRTVSVFVWYLDHDGIYLTARQHIIEIGRWDGEKPIKELSVQPASMVENGRAKRDKIVQRGRHYLELIKSDFAHRMYDGMLSRQDNPYLDKNKSYFRGDVVVDPIQYAREKGSTAIRQWAKVSDGIMDSLNTNNKQKLQKINAQETGKLENIFKDEYCFLLPQWIAAFTIGTRGLRTWAWLDVDDIKDCTPNAELIKSVAMPDSDMKYIKSLAFYRKSRRRGPNVDVVDHAAQSPNPQLLREKGEGRIILLHGSPGLGKTYTVECLAQWSGRPLLRLTCAELGLDPANLEVNLDQHIKRAERWSAIVLIDEADIFLELRHAESPLKKEAIVSVFLRTLEYTSGLIFLTTNRARTLDPAAVDRMSLIVHYDTLTAEFREKICRNCIGSTTRGGGFKLATDVSSYTVTGTPNAANVINMAWLLIVFKLSAALANYRQQGGGSDYDDSDQAVITMNDFNDAREVILNLEKYYNSATHKDKQARLEDAQQI